MLLPNKRNKAILPTDFAPYSPNKLKKIERPLHMCEMNGSHAEVGENALFVIDNYVKLPYVLISQQFRN